MLFNFWRISAYFRRSWFCSRRLSVFERGAKMALCQMMLVKRNLRIIGDQVDQFLLIFFS
ncbi:hypothetical protein [Enterococcus faecalis]|uniref:hypothetical protein n=1 Tax=Enterococcus faecalis TaxID=1351 RepID=UPI0009AC8364|nr:hypothetical protein [Enterococcus faecalis]